MSLQRTREQLTAGIVNVPLSKPAKLFFISEIDKVIDIYLCLESFGISFSRTDNIFTNKSFFISNEMIEPVILRQVFRNFRQLRPKIQSDFRYLFWELDDKSSVNMDMVLAIYRFLQLPVYIHETMRGYHFISIKPIPKDIWQWAIKKLHDTNPSFPRITLRIKPNKYVDEEKIFYKGFIMSEKLHTDTKQLRDMIVAQNFDKLQQLYQIVWYPLDTVITNKNIDRLGKQSGEIRELSEIEDKINEELANEDMII